MIMIRSKERDQPRSSGLSSLRMLASRPPRVIRQYRTEEGVMSSRRLTILVLVAALLAGCAAHTPPAPVNGRAPAADDEAGSIAANLLYAPGRGLLCGGSALMAGLVMVVTMGQSYDTASELMHGGCSGPWIVRPSDIRQAVP